MTIRTRTPLLLGALALALTACSGGGGEEPPADANTVEEAPVVENMDLNSLVEPTAPNTATPAAEEPAADENATAEEPERDVQQDDADAVGMTARVNRDEEATTSANDAQAIDEQ